MDTTGYAAGRGGMVMLVSVPNQPDPGADDYRPHAPRRNAVRDALRHTAVLRDQVDWRSAQILVPTLRVVMPFVTLRVTQRFCYVSYVCVRLRLPFRPSATYFDGAKVGKSPRSCFRPDFVGFLRPVTDPGVAATGHPWPGAASLASCQATPGSAPGLSRH